MHSSSDKRRILFVFVFVFGVCCAAIPSGSNRTSPRDRVMARIGGGECDIFVNSSNGRNTVMTPQTWFCYWNRAPLQKSQTAKPKSRRSTKDQFPMVLCGSRIRRVARILYSGPGWRVWRCPDLSVRCCDIIGGRELRTPPRVLTA